MEKGDGKGTGQIRSGRLTPHPGPRRDAARAGIIIGREGKESHVGRLLDSHSFRHSCVSSLDRSGLSEGLSRKPARASCRSILERYVHREFAELVVAIQPIPAMVIPGEGTAPPEEATVSREGSNATGDIGPTDSYVGDQPTRRHAEGS